MDKPVSRKISKQETLNYLGSRGKRLGAVKPSSNSPESDFTLDERHAADLAALGQGDFGFMERADDLSPGKNFCGSFPRISSTVSIRHVLNKTDSF